jgi:hypothetical protein
MEYLNHFILTQNTLKYNIETETLLLKLFHQVNTVFSSIIDFANLWLLIIYKT